MDAHFDHEKLDVYRHAIQFIAWSGRLLEQMPKSCAMWKQLDRASTSVALNIAEGNGKYTSADRCRFFDIARGSALESAAALDSAVARGLTTEKEIAEGKGLLLGIVRMLVGLIRSTSSDRVHEGMAEYACHTEQ